MVLSLDRRYERNRPSDSRRLVRLATLQQQQTSINRSISLAEGAIVHFCARSQSPVDSAVKDLRDKHSSTSVYGTALDVSDSSALTAWVDSAVQESSKIDAIVSNVSALATDNTAEVWTTAFNTDLLATVNLVNASLPHLEKSKGSIIAISSVSARDVDFTATSPYGAIKAGLVHYMAQLAHTLAAKGIRANTVSPGNIYIKDGVWGDIERGMPDLFKKQMELNPMGRMGKAEEIADAVVWMSSERASFVSGSNFVVDGALCTGVQL